MDLKHAGAALDFMIAGFSDRVLELRELVIARNMYPPTATPDLAAIDSAVSTLEYQVQKIKERVRDEMEVIPKAKKLIHASEIQQRKLEHMAAHLPAAGIRERARESNHEIYRLMQTMPKHGLPSLSSDTAEETPFRVEQKEKKGRGPAPRWFVTAEELNSLSSYMRGRLTLDKVNAAVGDMVAYAEANYQLISAPKSKIGEDVWQKALELRDISMKGELKGKHFFLEADMKGPVLKLDNTGKAIITVLRHLGRIQETRIGHHRVMILSKQISY